MARRMMNARLWLAHHGWWGQHPIVFARGHIRQIGYPTKWGVGVAVFKDKTSIHTHLMEEVPNHG